MSWLICRTRSWDGLTLYAASSDGTLAVFNFDPEELEGIAPHSVQEQYLQKFGFVPPPLPEGFSHHEPAHVGDANSRITPPPSPSRAAAKAPNLPSSQTGFGGVNGINGGGEVINKLVAKRSNKKRIQPKFMGSVPSAASPTLNQITPVAGPSNTTLPSRALDGRPSSHLHPSQLSRPMNGPPSHSISPVADNWPHGYDADVDMSAPTDMDVPIDSLSSGNNFKGKRKSFFDGSEDSKVKPRTLGGDRPPESVVVREISSGVAPTTRSWGDPHVISCTLPVLPLYNSLSVRVEGTEDILEGRNSEDDGVCIFFEFYSHGTTQTICR
jgi:protein HIRA/HIR1